MATFWEENTYLNLYCLLWVVGEFVCGWKVKLSLGKWREARRGKARQRDAYNTFRTPMEVTAVRDSRKQYLGMIYGLTAYKPSGK